MSGNLYIIATPIGNLKDLTIRAKETFEMVDVVVCEDTRVTSKLMASINVKKTLLAINQHANESRLSSVVSRLLKGENVAYVSDAGTPGVNDPGGKLVAMALDQGFTVIPIPGASALTTAISVCGFPMEHFTYLGFSPHKKGRQTFFQDIADRDEAVIFFESTHRLIKALESLTSVLSTPSLNSPHPLFRKREGSETVEMTKNGPFSKGGHRGISVVRDTTGTLYSNDRLVFVGRELTKMHETLYRGSASEVLEQIRATSDKGEAVIIVAPKKFRESLS